MANAEILSLDYQSEWNRLLEMKESGEFYRKGTLFNTNMNNYWYDSGTGKISILDDETFRLINVLYAKAATREDVDQVFSQITDESVKTFLDVVIANKLFSLPAYSGYKPEWYEKIDYLIDSELSQLILEVTEVCNFRCKYCIYCEDNPMDRNFGTSNMTWPIAKEAIDYGLTHCGKESFALTYYGGEPLVQFDLIKQCTDYALAEATRKGVSISFNLTSNMALMTEEMADYFASVPGFSIMASIDGPEHIHDKARVFTNNKGTFSETIRGLSVLSSKFKAINRGINVNAVFLPPYSFEKMEELNDFFSGLDLPNGSSIMITYPDVGTFDTASYTRSAINNPRYLIGGQYTPLFKWQLSKVIEKGIAWDKAQNIYFSTMINFINALHNRYQSEEPSIKDSSINGNCIPGVRKLYVTTHGDFKVCERVGESPFIGDVTHGIDHDKIKEIYIDEYLDKSESACQECWGINLCSLCYAQCMNRSGVDSQKKDVECQEAVSDFVLQLSAAMELYEQTPDVFEILKFTVTA